ncbi:MAG: cellulase family glycosylhydrolase [Planctomycetota bacterium]
MSGSQRWTVEQSRAWRDEVGWLMGANYLPRSAQNQLAMWQGETFDLAMIREEFGWAAEAGLNAFRIYLHDLLAADLPGFLERLERVCELASELGHRLILVFFDDCWRPEPRLGPQLPAVPSMHNSRWVQSPGVLARERVAGGDAGEAQRLCDYVSAVIERFDGHEAVVMWDLYNEPGGAGEVHDSVGRRLDESLVLLEGVFEWARGVGPTKPLTSGLWQRDESFAELNRRQSVLSDVMTFHFYGHPARLAYHLVEYRSYGDEADRERAAVCTEYMARTTHCLFFNTLPKLKEMGVGAIHWGLVRGASNTVFPWGSKPNSGEPGVWHHDLLHADGTAYDAAEVAVLRGLSPRG